MKVKDLIKSLEAFSPDDTIVMRNLYKSSHDPDYTLIKIRAYKWKGRIVIDGYEKVLEQG